jgi:hypothetical protein
MKRFLTLLGAATILAQLVLEPALARDQSHSSPTVLLPGAITGVGSQGPSGYRRLCEPISVGLNEWRVGFIEQLLKPSDAQKELLKKLLPASAEAKNAISVVLL